MSVARPDALISRIVRAYEDPIVRSYCLVRFIILRQRFLFEIGQYLPPSGTVLDIGCGFGLFALYFASRRPHLQIHGYDLNARRIDMARRAARALQVPNVRFEVGDAATFVNRTPIDGAYMLDLIHHIPPASVGPLLATIAGGLRPGGGLLIKDIEPTPAYKLAFTWLLDKLMDFRAPVRYWAPSEVHAVLEPLGFQVRRHSLVDWMPYPHVLYVASRPQDRPAQAPPQPVT